MGNPSYTARPPQLPPGRCCAAGPPWPPGPASGPPALGAASTALHTGPDLQERAREERAVSTSGAAVEAERLRCQTLQT